MDRLTTNKPVGEMTMTELAHNGCYRGEDGWARYRDYDTDVDARDLARKLLARYEPEHPIPEEPEDLEEFLFDELQYGANDHVGALVALVYNMIWSMADLRERLAAYEDTGFEPLEVDTMNTALCGWCHNYERLVEITNAEAEGRLIVLPCKVGDTVYAVEPDLCDLRDKDTCDAYCDGWDFSCPDFHSGSTIKQRHFQVEDLRHFGETVFPSHEEAAAALGGPNNG